MKKNNIVSIIGVTSLLILAACSDQISYSLDSTTPRVVDTTVASIPTDTDTVNAQKESFYFALNKTSNHTALKNLSGLVNKLKISKSKIKLEGHTDERGRDEYNYNLGKKRAEFIANQLVELGVPTERLEVISYGKQKPLATNHDESSWKMNRRVDVKYLS